MSDQKKRDDNKPGLGLWLLCGICALLLASTIPFLYYWSFVRTVVLLPTNNISAHVIQQAKKQFPYYKLLDIYSGIEFVNKKIQQSNNYQMDVYNKNVYHINWNGYDTYRWKSNSNSWEPWDPYNSP